MKKLIVSFFVFLSLVISTQLCTSTNLPKNLAEIYNYCNSHGYNNQYCLLVDFSQHSGKNRFYIYDFHKQKVVYKSLCAHGLGVCSTITQRIIQTFKTANNPKFSNQPGSNFSSLGKYRVGTLRPMTNPYYKEGYTLHGLDSTNSNALKRAILIHRGNLGFTSYPFPCLPVSKGCFSVSNTMMKHIKRICNNTQKPLLLYAYQ